MKLRELFKKHSKFYDTNDEEIRNSEYLSKNFSEFLDSEIKIGDKNILFIFTNKKDGFKKTVFEVLK